MPLFQPGDMFSWRDLFSNDNVAYGIVLNGCGVLIIRGDVKTTAYTIDRIHLPPSAIPLTPGEHEIPSEVRLALNAVQIALSL